MKGRTEALLWLVQRVSAAVLALAVTLHIATVVYAVRGGLTATEIIERLQGNVAWFVFYVVFVAAAVLHVPLGLRTILAEMTPLRGPWLGALVAVFGVTLAILGWRAAFALFAYGAH